MKTMIIGAFALALAVPAAAQTAPATAHADHAQHQGMDHNKHGESGHDCKECCEKMKQQDGKMECMDKKEEAKSAAPSSEHQGHAH
jgi:hypothetical protein